MNPAPDNKDWKMVEPIDVELSLSSTAVMLGEPLVLYDTVANAWPEVIATYMGMDLEGWLTFHLVDAVGQEVPILWDPRVQNPGGMHTNGARVSPHSYFHGHVVLSQRFAITQVGEYQLSVQVHLPYAPDEQEGLIWPEQFEETYGTVFKAAHSFQVSVTEANPARLRATAEALASHFVHHLPNGDTAQVQALFSMPEEYARESWRTVAYASSLSHIAIQQETARELTRLNSIAAADILADMIWKPAQMSAESWPRSSWVPLHNMYFSAGPELKQHIQTLFREHNQAVLDAPILITD